MIARTTPPTRRKSYQAIQLIGVVLSAACGGAAVPSPDEAAGGSALGVAPVGGTDPGTASADQGGSSTAPGGSPAATGSGGPPTLITDQAGGGGGPSAVTRPLTILDAHTHFWDLSLSPAFSNGQTELPDEYARTAGAAGISGTILIESVWQNLDDNLWGLELARRNPVVVGVIGKLALGGATFPQDLATLASNQRFRGLRISAQELAAPDTSLLSDRGLVAEVDVAGSAENLLLVAQNASGVPKLRIVVEHAGGLTFGGNPEGELAEALARAAQAPNVFCKVSRFQEQAGRSPAPTDAAAYAASLDFLLEHFGEDRLLFGTNWPLSQEAGSLESAVHVMREYWGGKGAQAERKFFAGNAASLYGTPEM